MAGGDTRPRSLTVAEGLLASGIAVCGATAITHPIDVVKVQLQLALRGQGGSSGARADAFSISRFVNFFPVLYKERGAPAFFAGVRAAMMRAATYGSARIGLCEPFQSMTGSQSLGALSAGVFATVIGNPFEVLKVRMQARPELVKTGEVSALRVIVKEEGAAALAKGFQWAAARSALLTVSQVVPYSWSKDTLRRQLGLQDGPALHLAASLAAGVVTTTATAPVDVMKTRVMSGVAGEKAGSVTSLLKQDGGFALFRGWLANYVRLGPQTLFIFVFHEQAKRLVELVGNRAGRLL